MKIITIIVLVMIATSVIVIARDVKIEDVKDLKFDKPKNVKAIKVCEEIEKNGKIKIKCTNNEKDYELASDMIKYNEESGVVRVAYG